MAFCSKCGAQLADNAAFCPVCGQPVKRQETYYTTPNTKTDNEKIMSILSYIGILVLIPILAEPNNPNVRFHANQGLVLFLCGIVISVVSSIITAIFAWTTLFFITLSCNIAIWIVSIGLIALMICGIVNAAKGEQKELPVIGGIRILR